VYGPSGAAAKPWSATVHLRVENQVAENQQASLQGDGFFERQLADYACDPRQRLFVQFSLIGELRQLATSSILSESVDYDWPLACNLLGQGIGEPTGESPDSEVRPEPKYSLESFGTREREITLPCPTKVTHNVTGGGALARGQKDARQLRFVPDLLAPPSVGMVECRRIDPHGASTASTPVGSAAT
jgi:hypothetical protein